MNKPIVIIGAGMAGLACAAKLQEKKYEYIIVEKSNRVGGRVGSIYENGYIYDVGFQVFNTSYIKTMSLLNLKKIDLKPFKPGALIYKNNNFNIVSDPFREPSRIFTNLLSNISSITDKLKILSLIYSLKNYSIKNDIEREIETNKYLKNYGFSNSFIENFFMPFLSGIFLENKLETSSKFFKYVFSKFSNGYATLPAKGMQQIPNTIFDNLNKDSIRLGSSVLNILPKQIVQLDNGEKINASKIVFTGDSHNLISNNRINYNSVLNLYFSKSSILENKPYIYLFPEDRYINNIAILTAISGKYTAWKDNLISVSILKNKELDNDQIKTIQMSLSKYFGGDPLHYIFLKQFKIKKATIMQYPDFFKNKGDLVHENGKIIAGDHMINGSIEGAVISGLKAAEKILKIS